MGLFHWRTGSGIKHDVNSTAIQSCVNSYQSSATTRATYTFPDGDVVSSFTIAQTQHQTVCCVNTDGVYQNTSLLELDLNGLMCLNPEKDWGSCGRYARDNVKPNTKSNKKAQLSLTNPRDAKACQKLFQFDVLTTLSLTILAYLHSFSCCYVRNPRNPEKSTENSNLWSSRSSKVIDLGVNPKPMYDFLLVTLAVSATVFEILTLKAGKSLNFHTLPFFEAP